MLNTVAALLYPESADKHPLSNAATVVVEVEIVIIVAVVELVVSQWVNNSRNN